MQLYRADREGRKHGGCALYVRNDLTSQLVTTHSNRACDTLIVKIKSLNIIIIVNYRPPDAKEKEFEEQLKVCQDAIEDIIEKDPKVKDIFQVGDFNMNAFRGQVGKYIQRKFKTRQLKRNKLKCSYSMQTKIF